MQAEHTATTTALETEAQCHDRLAEELEANEEGVYTAEDVASERARAKELRELVDLSKPKVSAAELTKAAVALLDAQDSNPGEDSPEWEPALGNAEHDVEAVLDALGVECE